MPDKLVVGENSNYGMQKTRSSFEEEKISDSFRQPKPGEQKARKQDKREDSSLTWLQK